MTERVRSALPGALFTLLLVAAACSEGNDRQDDPTTLPSGPLGEVTPEAAGETVLGLCATLATLESDPPAAETAFDDRSHDQLHVIAGALEGVDREAAARLLETKQKVESGFAGEMGPARGDVEALLRATWDGLAVLSIEVPGCPT